VSSLRTFFGERNKTLWHPRQVLRSHMSKPSKRVLRLPIEKRAEIAFKIAVAKAIDEHSRLGLPVYIWRNGKVVELSPDKARSVARSRRRKF
jgi:hypothetical protein